MNETRNPVIGSNEWLTLPTPRVTRGEALVYAALIAIGGGAAGAAATSHMNRQEVAFEQGVRADNLAQRVDGFTGTYNRFVGALGEEIPENADAEWLAQHNYRVEIAQRGLRGLCTRSDEATWLDRLPAREAE